MTQHPAPVPAAPPDVGTPAPDAGTPSARRPGLPGWGGLRDLEREAAVTALFDRHHTELVRLAVLVGAQGDAEDIASEAFCELYLRWPRLRDPAAAPAYLRSVVCNLVRMRLRHLQVVRRHPEPGLPDAGSAEQEVVLREDHREVVDALRGLPDRQREALVLRYWLDLSEAEVAATMGISCGAVKSHTARGMAALTKALKECR
ncbi:RNA polymerase sigma factor [Kineosporia sp. A_224]|uniref:RNA polymerase sigma factor n=1 Tax=Kineosporia sp. A_224 TaxID=1962180 RepID=UPI000B4AC259|nr:SigE family RNA polymerase sigma factor [Kineosporia sp. A_224]